MRPKLREEIKLINKESKLYKLGLKEGIIKEFNDIYSSFHLGRVVIEQKGLYKIVTEEGEINGRISGKIIYEGLQREDYPAVGDWVVLDRSTDANGDAIIHGILSRFSKLSRKVAGVKSDEQIIGANIDKIFICMALNNDFNIRRLERYITIAWDSGAIPVIVLTKADLCLDLEDKVSKVDEISMGIEKFIISSHTGEGISLIEDYIQKSDTIAFVGSSGVGKSTLINRLMGFEKQVTNGVRAGDDRGKHTTTHRELIVIPNGGVVIDTPGMRELQLLDNTEGVDSSFKDISELSSKCKFSDCSHQSEPGCAIKKAIEDGILSAERLESYFKLKKEAEYMERKINKAAASQYKKDIIKLHKGVKRKNTK